MKSFTIFFLLIGSVFLQSANGAGTPLAVTEMLEGSEHLMNNINTLNNLIENVPIIKYIREQIAKIDIAYDKLKSEEVKLIKDALVKTSTAESKFSIMRIVLNSLADETMSQTSRLLNMVKRIKPEDAYRSNKQLKIVHRRFMGTIDRSKVLLKKSLNEYERIDRDLSIVLGKLKAFQTQVDTMKNEHSRRYNEDANKIRAEAYGASAACVVIPASCPIVYATVAGIIETKLKDYKNRVNGLKNACNAAKTSASSAYSRIQEQTRQYKKEYQLLIEWESSVHEVANGYNEFEYLQDEIEVFKEDVISTLQRLINAASAFSNTIKNSELGKWVQNNPDITP